MDRTKPIRKELEKFLDFKGLDPMLGLQEWLAQIKNARKGNTKLLTYRMMHCLEAQVELLMRLEEAGMLKEEGAGK